MAAEVGLRHLADALRQLELCVRAGLPVPASVEVIAAGTPDRALARMLRAVGDDLASGLGLSVALHLHGRRLPPYVVGVVRAAEASGGMDRALGAVSRQLDREVAARTAMWRAATYPLVVMVFAGLTVGVLTFHVVPRFLPLFAELGTEVPFMTRALLGVAGAVRGVWPWGAVLLAATAGLGWLRRRRVGRVLRTALERVILRTPMIGPILTAAGMERFCRVLALALAAGVPPAEAMWITAGATGVERQRVLLDGARDRIWAGGSITGALVDTGLFTPQVELMLRVGEETGTLAVQLEMAGEFFAQRLEDRLTRLAAVIEPVMILLVGLVVGMVALGLVTAVYGVLGGLEGMSAGT